MGDQQQFSAEEVAKLKELLENSLNKDEVKAAKAIIKANGHAQWFWAQMRVWGAGAVAIIVGLNTFWDGIIEFLKK